jgi:glucoamylase
LLPPPASDWALEVADFWNANIERWTSVSGTPLAQRLGVSGYYVLVLPVQILERPEIFHQVVPIHNPRRRGRRPW